METLFAMPEALPKPRVMLNFHEEQARELTGSPANWRAYLWRCLPGRGTTTHFQVTGAVCEATYTKGKRKGERNWSKIDKSTERTAIFSVAEHKAYLNAWEAKTGKCYHCQGYGEELASCSVSEGTKYRPCHRCHQTGKAPNPPQPAQQPAASQQPL